MRQTALVGLFSLAVLACTGTDVGNPVVDLDFSLHESEVAGGTVAREIWAGAVPGLTLDEAWVVVDRIRLREGSDCSGQAEFELRGPYFVDLFGQGTLPALRDIEVPGDQFCRFEFRWDAEDMVPSNAPSDLQGASLLMTGTRTDGTRFVLKSARNDEFRLDAKDNTFSLSDATGTLFVSFDAAFLFTGIDLLSAEVGGDGVIRIDKDNNSDLIDIFDTNLADAAKLFDDDNNDGELDQAESVESEILAES